MEFKIQKEKYKIAVIVILLFIACVLTYYFHVIVRTGLVFTHLFYIPIILAAIWWKRKGLIVPVFLSILLIFSHIFFRPDAAAINDYIRAFMFLAVGFITTMLNGRTIRARGVWQNSFNSLEDIMVIINRDYIIENINNYGLSLIGKSKEEVVGKKCYQVIYGRKKPSELCPFPKMLKTKKTELIERKKNLFNRYFSAKTSPIFDENGKIIKFVCLMRDITDRERIEEALREQKNKLQKYLDVAGMVIVILDTNGRILLINKKGYEILEYKANGIIGKNWFADFIPQKDRAKARTIFKNLIAGRMRHVKYCEIPALTEKGRKKIIVWHITVLNDEQGKVQAILNTGIDITELRQAETAIQELKELNKLKDDFLNISTHELKTPLTSIVGLSEVISEKNSSLSPEYHKYIDIIHEEGSKLTHIVKRILTVTRYESGRETVYKESFDLASFIPSLLSSLNMIAKKKKSKIIINIKERNINIKSDKAKISQVIYNLVDNAIKYGPEEQNIVISATRLKKDRIKIAVTDQGKGIPKNLQGKLFAKFSQLEPSLSRTQEGTGLGLYICKLIINKLGGEIGVESGLGKGSTFYFIIPVF